MENGGRREGREEREANFTLKIRAAELEPKKTWHLVSRRSACHFPPRWTRPLLSSLGVRVRYKFGELIRPQDGRESVTGRRFGTLFCPWQLPDRGPRAAGQQERRRQQRTARRALFL